ncbi:nucleotidyltransferase family protein [Elusimicrobiota bacterium]
MLSSLASFKSKRDFQRKCRSLRLELVVLFGSRNGENLAIKPDSDLDIAVLDSEPFSHDRHSDVHGFLFDFFENYDLDFVMFNRADPLFRYEIMRNCQRLYGDPLKFLEYKSFAFRDYVDSRDLLDLEDALFRKKFSWIKEELYGTA